MKRGITAEDVPIPVGLQQAVVLQTRQVLSLLVNNMLKISFAFCSSHLGTNNRILMFVRQAETRFWNGIVRGSCGYLRYGPTCLPTILCCISMDKCLATM